MSLYTYLMIKTADPTNMHPFKDRDKLHGPATKKTRRNEDKKGNPYPSGQTINLPVQIATPGKVFREDGSGDGSRRRVADGYHYSTESRDLPTMTGIPGYGYFADDYPMIPGLPFAAPPLTDEQKAHIKKLEKGIASGKITLDDMLDNKYPAPPNADDFNNNDLTSVGWYDDTGWFGKKRKPMWDYGLWNWSKDGREETPGLLWGSTPTYGPDNETYDTIANSIAQYGDSTPMYRDLFQNDYRTEKETKVTPDSVQEITRRIPMAEPALRKYRPELFRDE